MSFFHPKAAKIEAVKLFEAISFTNAAGVSISCNAGDYFVVDGVEQYCKSASDMAAEYDAIPDPV